MLPPAFLLGVSKCKSGGLPLYGTDHDIEAIRGRIQSFDEVILQGPSATKPEFLRLLMQYRTEVVARQGCGTGTGAKLLVYFAGHGTTFRVLDPTSHGETEHQALCLSDFELGVDTTALSDEELAQHLLAFPRDTEITVILDCCFSGGVAPDLKGTRLSWPRRMMHRLGQWRSGSHRRARYIAPKPFEGPFRNAVTIRRIGFERALLKAPNLVAPSLVLFAACQANQVAWEDRYDANGGKKYYGIFTWHLSEVLSKGGPGGSMNKDVQDAVRKAMAAAGADQEPLLYPEDSTRTFPQ